MRAGIDLIPLLIFVAIAVVSSLLKKKASKEEQEEHSALPRPRGSPAARPKSWEEELRDLLQQKAPPPVTPETARRPVPVRPVPRERVVVRPPVPPLPSSEDVGIEMHLPAPSRLPDARFATLTGLRESAERYGSASTLEQRTRQHLHDVTRQRVGSTSVDHYQSPAARAARQMFHDRTAIRGAVLATVILGPPVGLE